MELLLHAVGACTAIDVVSILKKKRERLVDYRVEVRGVERRADHPKAWTRIELKHILTGVNLSKQAVERAISLSEEKYCSVAATLRPTATIISTYEIREAASQPA